MVSLKAVLVHAAESMRKEIARKTQIMLARQLGAIRLRELKTL